MAREALRWETAVERFSNKEPFVISGWVFDELRPLVVTVRDSAGRTGRGEALGVYYHGENADSMAAQIEACRPQLEAGADRQDLLTLLPPGGARNAADAALWELESLQTGLPVWRLAGLDHAEPMITTATLAVETPALMAAAAVTFDFARILKLKLDGSDQDADRIRAVKAARPSVRIAVDANQGWSIEHLKAMLPVCVEAGVELIEQPLRIGEDSPLASVDSPIPFAADESFQTADDLPAMHGRYQMVNLKLDKTGGLTAALAIAEQARAQGFGLMVGNMGGSSLAMAPHWVLAQICDFVDVDGPLFLKQDRVPGCTYLDGKVDCPPGVWGAP